MLNMSQKLPSPPPDGLNSGREGYEPPDLGNMTWQFCKKPIRKVSDDVRVIPL